jgi:sugar-phosphatase
VPRLNRSERPMPEARPTNTGGRLFKLECLAVLLDSDGVLVDSEGSIRRAFYRWAAGYGLDGEEVYTTLRGHRAADIAAATLPEDLVQEGAVKLDACELEDAHTVRALPGSREFVDSLIGDWTVVSSGPMALVRARLAAANLPEPAYIIAADSVARGKPDPESYLLAAARNGVAPASCVVFEDSETGISAADAAGCVIVKVGGENPGSESRYFVPDLRSARAWLGPSGKIELQLLNGQTTIR